MHARRDVNVHRAVMAATIRSVDVNDLFPTLLAEAPTYVPVNASNLFINFGFVPG